MSKELCLLSLRFAAAAAVMVFLAPPANAADPIEVEWYSVNPSYGDFNLPPCGTYNCGQVYDNSNPEVGRNLVGGMPVVSAGNPAGLIEGAGNPLNWWIPSGR